MGGGGGSVLLAVLPVLRPLAHSKCVNMPQHPDGRRQEDELPVLAASAAKGDAGLR